MKLINPIIRDLEKQVYILKNSFFLNKMTKNKIEYLESEIRSLSPKKGIFSKLFKNKEEEDK